MPMRAFQIMYKEAQKREASHYRELLDLAMAPYQPFDFYTKRRSYYNSLMRTEKLEIPEAPSDTCVKADSEDAKVMMMAAFRSFKKGMGYGG